MHQIPILLPLVVGTGAMLCTTLIHAMPVGGLFGLFAARERLATVNFTTLGYGDVLLSLHWRMLGPLEAATGMLMFGVSTAQVFTVILRLAQARFADLSV